jgi:hypothetical protein
MNSSEEVLYSAGEYEVRLVEVSDTRLGEGKFSNAYGIFHKPTGVLNGTSMLYFMAIKGAWSLNKELEETRKDPGDEQNPAPQGFGMVPMGFN